MEQCHGQLEAPPSLQVVVAPLVKSFPLPCLLFAAGNNFVKFGTLLTVRMLAEIHMPVTCLLSFSSNCRHC